MRHYLRHDVKSRKTYSGDCQRIGIVAAELVQLGFVREYTIICDKARTQYRVDFAHPRKRIVVEYDGPGHQGPTQRVMDQRRDRMLKAAGWRVVRIRVGLEPEVYCTAGRRPGDLLHLLRTSLSRQDGLST